MRPRPSPWMLWLLQLPVWLYRLGLGWMLGERFLLVNQVGRRSGRPYQTVLKVMAKTSDPREAWLVGAGWGLQSDWLVNVLGQEWVLLRVGSRPVTARVSVLDSLQGAEIIHRYANGHPWAFRIVYTLLSGRKFETLDAALVYAAEFLPVVTFESEL